MCIRDSYYAALHSRNGEKALEYLNRRGVEPEIQKKFGIGYAPQGRDNLYKYLSSKGFDREAMVKSGLVMESKDGRGLYAVSYTHLDVAEPDDHTIGVLNHIKEEGFKICLLSNNNEVRIKIFNKKIGAYAYWKAGKRRV